MLVARKKNLSNARARKNKYIARMLVDARKDHSIPLFLVHEEVEVLNIRGLYKFHGKKVHEEGNLRHL